MYVECVFALKDKYNYVLITTHGVILEELKEEYKQRAISRNSNNEFINGFFSKREEYIHDGEKNTNAKKVILNENEYLSDIIDKLK